MTIKLGSVVMFLLMVFFAKISIETVSAEKLPQANFLSDRSPASIDKSYKDHMNRR
jgi:hypothetical protein